MRHIDLFSGIGGFALAIDNIYGKENVEHIFCDNEPFAQEVLRKHWPEAQIYGDIRSLTADTERERYQRNEHQTGQSSRLDRGTQPFLLTGGFPCQPFSQAGRRRGTEDDRYLWPEMFRVIREFKPTWVIAENVGGLVTWNNGMVLEQVFSDLEGEGYEVQPFIIPAVAQNAPHRRDRVWIVAHAASSRGGGESCTIRGKERRQDDESVSECEHADSDVTDARRKRRGQRTSKSVESASKEPERSHDSHGSWDTPWLEVATRLCRVDDGVPRRLDRNPRLKALGNAIVPQVAEEIIRAISI